MHSLRAGRLPKAWVQDVLQQESDTDTVVDGKSIGLVKVWLLLPQCLGSHLGLVGESSGFSRLDQSFPQRLPILSKNFTDLHNSHVELGSKDKI